MATLQSTQRCEFGGKGRFAVGKPACNCRDIAEYPAGAYGTAVLCSKHREIARACHEEAMGAERESGHALAQMLKDERRMMRG